MSKLKCQNYKEFFTRGRSTEGWKNKKIVIIGLGISGLALAKFLKEKGAKITGCDKEERPALLKEFKKLKIDFQLGSSYLKNLENFDLIFISPGVSKDLPEIKKAKRQGIEISSEIKLFFELCPCPIIGITGTNGKSTTTTLIGKLLRQRIESRQQLTGSREQKTILVGGNIGEPVIDKLEKLDKNSLVVLELSSFQLEDLDKSPHIGVFLNITPDHLDRYENFKSYFKAKKSILKYQGKNDFIILNLDDPLIRKLQKEAKGQVFMFSCQKELKRGTFLKNNWLWVRYKKINQNIVKKDDLKIPGSHNISNALAAILVAVILGVGTDSIKKVLSKFKGLEHRIEFVKEVNGVKYYNDSKATTPESTMAAINSFAKPIILITGGYDKHVSFAKMAKEIIKSSVKEVILMGATAGKIEKEISDKRQAMSNKQLAVSKAKSLEEAVRLAFKDSKKGDIVLLSPACASFDMFKNFEERGKVFKELIKQLAGNR